MRKSLWNPMSWLDWLQSTLARVARAAPKAIFPSVRLHLEELEARLVPSIQANPESASTALNTAVTMDVLANDIYTGTVSLGILGGPAYGSASVNGSQEVVYSPPSGYYGTVSFEYGISNTQGSSFTTDTITVGAGAVLYAVSDTASAPVGSTITMAVESNDTIPSGDTVSLLLMSEPTGSAMVSGSDVVYKAPNQSAEFIGTTTFTYELSDSYSHSAFAADTVSVDGIDNLLSTYAVSATEGLGFTATLVTFSEFGVSAGQVSGTINWGDGTQGAGTYAVTGLTGAHTYADAGTYTISGTVEYEAYETFSFTCTATVADAPLSASGATVKPVLDVPWEGTVATFNSLNTDGSAGEFTASISWGDGNSGAGTISSLGGGNYAVTGSHDYTTTLTGGAEISVTIRETGNAEATATDPVTVYYIVAESDSTQTAFGTPVTMDVTANDIITPGDSVGVSVISAPADGTATVSGTSVIYTPSGDFAGADTFVYEDVDTLGNTSSATDTVAVNDVVSFAAASFSIYETGGTATITVGLLAASDLAVTVDYATSDDEDAAGVNYTPTSGTLTIAPEATQGTFDVPIINNNADGVYPVTVTLTLSDPQNAALGTPNTAELDINDLAWSDPTTVSWTQTPASPPAIGGISNQSNAEGDSVNLTVSASDSSGTIEYDALELPPGLSINSSSGVISGTIGPYAATDAQVLGTDGFTVTAIAEDGGAYATTTFDWAISTTVPTPTIDPPNQTDAVGDNVSLQVAATQFDSDALNYSAAGLPDGLTIDPVAGLISGVIDPSAASSVPYTVVVSATDNTPATPQTGYDTFYWTVDEGTPSPMLASPGNQVNAAGDVVDVTLTGSDSGTYSLTYIASGLPAGLSIDPESGEITGTISNSAVSTTPYAVTIAASDGQDSATVGFSWAVGGVSLQVPDDQTNLDGDVVMLALTATDAASGTLDYSAVGLPAGLAINSATGIIDGTIGNSADAGSPYTATVVAGDGTYSEAQTFSWTVSRVMLNVPEGESNFDGAVVSLGVTADDNVHSPTFSVSGLPGGLSIDSSTGLVSGTIGANDHDQSPYQVTLTAADGTLSDVESFVWSVTPQVQLVSPGTQYSAFGDVVSLAATASDHASGTLAFSASGLPTGLSINSSTGLISGTISGSAASSYNSTITATDGTFTSAQTFSWSVANINLPPIADQDNMDDDSVSLSAAAGYHGGGTLAYSASGLPAGLSINATTGLISGTIGNTDDSAGPSTDGMYTVDLMVTDGIAYSVSQTFDWEVDARLSFDDGDSDQTNVPGDSVSVAISAEDNASGTPTVTYSVSGLPGGLSIDSSTGIISGTITATASATPDSVTVTASDGTASATESFNWTLSPVVLPDPSNQVSAGQSTVSFALTADVPSGYTLTYGESGLPDGLSLNSTTGLVSGTLSSGDTGSNYLVTVDAVAGTVTSAESFAWTVSKVAMAEPADQTNTEGDSVSLAVSAQAVSGTLTYSAVGLPPGLSINSSTGVISGTVGAGAAEIGPFSVEVVASNGWQSASQTFNWNVNPLVNVTSIDDQTVVEGDSVSLQVTASESGATLTYSATGLPAGLSINASTGLITGTISAGDAADSPYAVDVTAGDGTYYSDVYWNYTISDGSTVAPTATSPGTQVNVTGDFVSFTVSASDTDGGTLSYAASGLPDGLSIDPNLGVVSGQVAEDAVSATPYVVTVTATDNSSGLTATQTFSWIVNDSAIALTANPISATAYTDTTYTLAEFTDTDPNWTTDDFTASINWGDGTTDDNVSGNAVVNGGNGTFTVVDDHAYTATGTYTPTIELSDGFQTLTATATASVAVEPLELSGGLAESGAAGTINGEWAYFTDANTAMDAGDYSAVIYWGDDSSSGATLSGSNGAYVVSGNHSYSSNGSYAVTVVVSDTDGTSATVTSSAQVGDILAGDPTYTVSSFQSSDPNATAGQFSASINWGDGGSAGTVSGAGPFNVSGTHDYASSGNETMTVSVAGPQNESITTTNTVAVAPAPIIGIGTTFVEQEGVPFDANLGAIIDPNLGDTASSFQVTVNFGDGSGPVVATETGGNGLFNIDPCHTYQFAGTFDILITIAKAGIGLLRTYNDLCYVNAEQEKLLPAPSVNWADLQGILKQSKQAFPNFTGFKNGILNEMMATVPTINKGMEDNPQYQKSLYLACNVEQGAGFILGRQYHGGMGQKYVVQFVQISKPLSEGVGTNTLTVVEVFPVAANGNTYADPIGMWLPLPKFTLPASGTVSITYAYGTSYNGETPDPAIPLTAIGKETSTSNAPNPKQLTLEKFEEIFTPAKGRTSEFANQTFSFEAQPSGTYKLSINKLKPITGKDGISTGLDEPK